MLTQDKNKAVSTSQSENSCGLQSSVHSTFHFLLLFIKFVFKLRIYILLLILFLIPVFFSIYFEALCIFFRFFNWSIKLMIPSQDDSNCTSLTHSVHGRLTPPDCSKLLLKPLFLQPQLHKRHQQISCSSKLKLLLMQWNLDRVSLLLPLLPRWAEENPFGDNEPGITVQVKLSLQPLWWGESSRPHYPNCYNFNLPVYSGI